MKLSTSNMALIAGAAVLVVAVLWMPRVPSSSQPAAPMVESSPIELAIAKVSGENPMEGIMELRAMADEEPPNLEAVLWLGRFAVQSGQLDKARERFTQVIDARPDNVEAHWEMAMLNLEEGFLEEAVAGFDLCVAADELYANGRFFKARCLEAMGQTEAALNEYKSYLPLAPDTVVAQSVEGIIERLEAGEPSPSI